MVVLAVFRKKTLRLFNNEVPMIRKANVLGDVVDSASKGMTSESNIKIRKYFPETWLWNDTTVGYD